ncbi:MAG: methionyl-tRNA formyltransferase [Deltaproteobacteria bacterium]|jgi:methionyl-tRNA formyltransferase|nr:methionyl-tRNA formyltransferase [Deltaproteobacteria bacterium]
MAMRIVFFGTPAFAVPSLDALLAGPHAVVTVVTQPERPAGRGRAPRASPVSEVASRAGIPVLTPTKLRDGTFAATLRELAPDLCVVVAYGRILPVDVLAVPRLGYLNVHASLLPSFRGAAPIAYSLLAGDTVTGVSLMKLTEGMDEGPVLAMRELAIDPADDCGALTTKLAQVGAALLIEHLAEVEDGRARFAEQDHARATYARPIARDDAALSWSAAATSLVNRVRAMAPAPGAFTTYPGGVLKVYRARVEGPAADAAPGTLVEIGADGPRLACGEGSVRLLEVQREGGRRQRGDEFARGARLAVGERWG